MRIYIKSRLEKKGTGHEIVIIDDDNLVSLSLNTILSAQDDIEVSAVGDSGQQAVKLYEEHMPDVMLMDIRMQGMTGLEAAEKYSQISGCQNTSSDHIFG